MVKLAFNATALGAALSAPKARVRVAEMDHYQELQVRPTDRASNVNLPKGEVLVDMQEGQIEIPEEMSAGLAGGQFLVLQSRKHGWIALVNATPIGNAPGAAVSA